MTQAIHLPTLARLTNQYHVAHIMDVSGEVAERVARRAGSRWSTTVDDLLADDAVDVVAICSPHVFHVEHVEAAITAGVKGILCEKPLALTTSDARRVATVVGSARVPLVVGTMHAFDPGWVAATRAWGRLPAEAHTVRSSIVLPPNRRFEELATQLDSPRPMPGAMNETAQKPSAARYRDAVLTLAIHDLPLVRRFVPTIDSVLRADVVEPYGYAIQLDGGGRTASLTGRAHRGWRAAWTFDAWSRDAHLHVDFTPSYVQAGSATATLTDASGARQFGPYPDNGYVEEWRRLADLAQGVPQDPRELQHFIDDVIYAIEIAEAVPLPRDLTISGGAA